MKGQRCSRLEDEPFVSVVIPVYNDPHRLRHCLAALEKQTYPSNRYEVLAVDNGSEESIEPVVAEFGQARAALQSIPGSYAARNRGIQLAKGEVLAFTDADCIPAADWVEQGVEALRAGTNVGLVGGGINVFYSSLGRPTPVEFVDDDMHLNQERACRNGFAFTANVFTHRSVFEEVGPFDDRLKSGGDVEWGHRVSAHGFNVAYAEAACVAHPARRTYAALAKKKRRVITGYHDQQTAAGYSFWQMLKDTCGDLKPPVRTGWRILAARKLPRMAEKLEALLILIRLKGVSARTRVKLWCRDHWG